MSEHAMLYMCRNNYWAKWTIRKDSKQDLWWKPRELPLLVPNKNTIVEVGNVAERVNLWKIIAKKKISFDFKYV